MPIELGRPEGTLVATSAGGGHVKGAATRPEGGTRQVERGEILHSVQNDKDGNNRMCCVRMFCGSI